MKTLVAFLTVCCLATIAAARLNAADTVTTNDLKQIGLAYHNHFDAAKKAPAKSADLSKYFDGADAAKRLTGLIDSGEIVFAFGVGILDMKDGTSNTVLAYTKETPKDGGLALYGDGSVKKMTAAEFKKAIIAKPKK